MQTLRMFRLTVVVQSIILFLVVTATCFAQSASQQNSVANPAAASATAPQSVPAAEPEADTDSADIPPFARSRISEEEYFALRDQEIRTRRGIDDLIRTPQARSQAVRNL